MGIHKTDSAPAQREILKRVVVEKQSERKTQSKTMLGDYKRGTLH